MGFLCKVIGHRWAGCRCARCGATRQEGHQWAEAEDRCEHTCTVCGQSEPVPHEWFHCRCKRCGEQRDDHHLWLAKGPCEQVCRICGQERETHDWRHVNRGVDRCAICGQTYRLSPEEIARRDEEWSAADDFAEAFPDWSEEPPEVD